MKDFLSSKIGIIIAGVGIGVIAILLQVSGNPQNMAICVACFLRDTAGALGLHRVETVQYIRPEIIGLFLGAMSISLVFRELKPRGGSSTLIRFMLGFFAMTGALIFLGCPWRTIFRIAGGDANALVGLAGLVSGIFAGSLFLKKGYTLGRTNPLPKFTGIIFPLIAIGVFAAAAVKFSFFENGPLFYSSKGPGSMHAPLFVSLAGGLLVGAIAQRSRFCTIGAFRDIFITKQMHLLYGVLSLLVTVLVFNVITGRFVFGFENQPIAHTNHLMNFSGMLLAGLAFVLAGGCPGRQVVLAGEGDTDSVVFILGMIAGGAFAHNFAFASSPAGPGAYGVSALIIGLVFCLSAGFFMRNKI